eukprot:1243536-Pleurochrysis_carterae.AAC.1
MLRRPSRRCLLRRAALRRALEAINAWLLVAIGADILAERGGGRLETVRFTRVGDQVRLRHAPSMEGRSNAKSTAASLSCSSTFSKKRTALMSNVGADTTHNFTVSSTR